MSTLDQCGRCLTIKLDDGFELCADCQQECMRNDDNEELLWSAEARHKQLMESIVAIIRNAAVRP